MAIDLVDSLEASGIENRDQIWLCGSSNVSSPSSVAHIYNHTEGPPTQGEKFDWKLMGVITSDGRAQLLGPLDGSKL